LYQLCFASAGFYAIIDGVQASKRVKAVVGALDLRRGFHPGFGDPV
jgi:hypothetical protein